jgi:hypothetical protein
MRYRASAYVISDAGDAADQVEETAFAFGIDAPVHGRELMAVDVIALRRAPARTVSRIKVSPGRVAAERGDEVVP